MKTKIILEMQFWRLAGFNCFIVGLCPTLHVRIAGVGLHYFLQFLLLFLAFNVLLFNVSGSILIGLPISCVFTWVMWLGIRYAIRLQHLYNSLYFLFATLVVNTIIAMLITIPFCLSIFQNEIDIANKLNTVDDGIFLIGPIIQPLSGLLLAGEGMGQSFIIRFCCGSIFSLVFFCCFIPYLLTYQILRSTYNTVFNLYERNFK